MRSPKLQIPETIRNVAETYFAQLIRIAGGLLFNIWLTRWLAPAERGYYGVALAVAMIATQIGQLGLNTADTYFAAKEPPLRKILLGNSMVAVLMIAPVLILTTIAVYRFSPSLVVVPQSCLSIALCYIPFALAYSFLQGLLLGNRQITKFNVLEVANRYIPLVILGFCILASAVTSVTVLAGVLIGQIIACIWAWAILYANGGGMSVSMPLMKDMLRYGYRIQLATVFSFLLFRMDLLMVGHMRSPAEAGYYSVATSFAEYLSLPAFVAGTILLPHLSSLNNSGEKFRMMLQWLWGMAAVTAPVFLIGIFAGRPMIRWLCGARYLPALPGYLWLLPGIYFLGLACIAVQFISSIGYRISVSAAWFLALALNLLGNLYAIPRFGIVGASAMSSVCYTLAFALIFLIAYRNRQSETLAHRTESEPIFVDREASRA